MKYNTLFLDRDGVINQKIINGYVTKIEEFEFLPNLLEALAILSKIFEHIIIVTNQQGIGKGIFSMDDLQKIHDYMLNKIVESGGRIDKIYVAPNLESENNINRKPQPGMAWQAKNDFPDIDFAKSLIAGDSQTDMQFGKNAGMDCAFLTNGNLDTQIIADYTFNDLFEFANKIKALG
jgi:histidinol-phosphate phosphatase family protein